MMSTLCHKHGSMRNKRGFNPQDRTEPGPVLAATRERESFPTVSMSMHIDQLMNARLLVELGVGLEANRVKDAEEMVRKEGLQEKRWPRKEKKEEMARQQTREEVSTIWHMVRATKGLFGAGWRESFSNP
ncbi:hypothetical protein Scep_023661 [Stephania cephalantha]|uniref:Uncharacterized protein n=1 Tax=Stephania cephalantha TaxID=152367 RepID=A0AAP0HXH4_9MAGN